MSKHYVLEKEKKILIIGIDYLHACLNGIHIPRSPFKLEVKGNNNNNNLSNGNTWVVIAEVVIVVVSLNLKFEGGSGNVNAIESCMQIVNAFLFGHKTNSVFTYK